MIAAGNFLSDVFLTNFGDSALLLPMAAAILVWLLVARASEAALWWIAALLVVMAGLAAVKIYLFACVPFAGFHSPSGHAGLSALVYGALALIAARDMSGWRRRALFLAAAVWVLAIALSRLAVGAHTLPEVVAGLVVGGAALALFWSGFVGQRRIALGVGRLLLGCALILLFLHGTELHAEELLHAIGRLLRHRSDVCR